MDDEQELIAVSPRHYVRLDVAYAALIRRAPRRDYVIRTITKREANGLPLMAAEIVIAGDETRREFPVADSYPLHFRKTYYPGRLHGEPRLECERQARASALIGLPPPIGYTDTTFRSCLLPGTPYDRLTPFITDPQDGNLAIARDLPLASAAGLWRLAEEAFGHLRALHQGGLSHGDAELHNFIVSPSPLEILPIDFEAAVDRGDMDDARWEARCAPDFEPLLKEAAFLLCRLGYQPGPLASMAWDHLDTLLKSPDRFRREIGRQTSPSA